MCDHKGIVRLADGWYCPECKEAFTEKPIVKKPRAKKEKKDADSK